MISTSCHCGAVRLALPHAPEALTDCNCTICRRYGALWGYYPVSAVRITGATEHYLRGERAIEFHRCRECGCVVCWSPVDKTHDRMGVNFRMAEPDVIAGVRVRKLDGFDTWKYFGE